MTLDFLSGVGVGMASTGITMVWLHFRAIKQLRDEIEAKPLKDCGRCQKNAPAIDALRSLKGVRVCGISFNGWPERNPAGGDVMSTVAHAIRVANED